jgi:hypothetical protein
MTKMAYVYRANSQYCQSGYGICTWCYAKVRLADGSVREIANHSTERCDLVLPVKNLTGPVTQRVNLKIHGFLRHPNI